MRMMMSLALIIIGTIACEPPAPSPPAPREPRVPREFPLGDACAVEEPPPRVVPDFGIGPTPGPRCDGNVALANTWIDDVLYTALVLGTPRDDLCEFSFALSAQILKDGEWLPMSPSDARMRVCSVTMRARDALPPIDPDVRLEVLRAGDVDLPHVVQVPTVGPRAVVRCDGEVHDVTAWDHSMSARYTIPIASLPALRELEGPHFEIDID